MESRKVRMNVMLDPGTAFGKTYKVTGWPTAVIVDQQGIVRGIKPGWGSQSLNQLIRMVDQLCPAG